MSRSVQFAKIERDNLAKFINRRFACIILNYRINQQARAFAPKLLQAYFTLVRDKAPPVHNNAVFSTTRGTFATASYLQSTNLSLPRGFSSLTRLCLPRVPTA